VQNWNDGKAQEFRDRKLYDIGRSHLTHSGPRPAYSNMDAAVEATMERGCCEPAQVLMKPETEEVKAVEADKRAENAVREPQAKVSPIGQVSVEDLHEALEGAGAILFKSPTCPNCKAAMALLDRAGVDYAAVNAADARELTAKYGVKQAPTLVVRTPEGFEKYRGVSDIKGWLMNAAHTTTR